MDATDARLCHRRKQICESTRRYRQKKQDEVGACLTDNKDSGFALT